MHRHKKRALRLNMEMEFRRNSERYRFLKWGTQAFEGLRQARVIGRFVE